MPHKLKVKAILGKNPMRDFNITSVQRLQKTRDSNLLVIYHCLKKSLHNLQEQYSNWKETTNLPLRYIKMKAMIKQVRETVQYLPDLPKLTPRESTADFADRICTHFEENPLTTTQNGAAATRGISLVVNSMNFAEGANSLKMAERLKAKSNDDLRNDIQAISEDITRLVRKYQSLKNMAQEKLLDPYQQSNFYPFIPRHFMLKSMVKHTLRSKEYGEVCHEAVE